MTAALQTNYAQLGPEFSSPTQPGRCSRPSVLLWNEALADTLGIDFDPQQQALVFSGQKLLPGSQPVAMAYSGHQFGQFNPHLGDGRAHLLGELTSSQGEQFDVHLKGSGRTPYSRNGDGLCALKPAVREFLMSEAMHALGVPTTRTLAVVSTGDTVMRQTPGPGAVVTRIANSHLRIGTFEHFAARGQHQAVQTLADLAIALHGPENLGDKPTKYLDFLSHVIDLQINLVVEWMRVGFIHGVMNTDNILVSGHTIDYGPCAMMGAYDPGAVFSSIDHQGRYAYGNQPAIMQWNLARLAECLLPLINDDTDQAVADVMPLIEGYRDQYQAAFHRMMAGKLGFTDATTVEPQVVNALLDVMQDRQLDYTHTFVQLGQLLSADQSQTQIHDQLTDWVNTWQAQLAQHGISPESAQQTMGRHNPVVIPRNQLVEQTLEETEQSRQADAVMAMLKVLRKPYEVQAETALYQAFDADDDLNYQTFCGT
ncbi:protein adenylyltransferase SelO [Marinicella meishanensis]|uniref:protein adenylyltransferase SelO n=1 Tax=Marinicella meishanensis TaxID=2873263 RepID=UPI001CBB5081|nr:YdiU family protein [Marinicella sp. NBU2979]